jgi:ABC-type phosphate/phosphonate transport system substrate-binding protein
MIASLAMYDFPATAGAHDRLWSLIRDALRDHGVAAPQHLTRTGELADHWSAPQLVLGQTCGSPYRNHLHGHVTLIGTPDYGVEGCEPGYYNSVFVIRAADTRDSLASFDGTTFAYNDEGSQSGWAAPQVHAAKAGIRLHAALKTGAHRESALAVAEGRAEIAALDAVTWALLWDHEDLAQGLRVLDRTVPTPGLPVIAAAGAPKADTFEAVKAGIAALSSADRNTLRLRDLVDIPAERYLAVPNAPPPDPIAIKAGALRAS